MVQRKNKENEGLLQIHPTNFTGDYHAAYLSGHVDVEEIDISSFL